MELTKRIEIRRMRILNFKGVREADHTFDPSRNIISGQNRAGKSTIQDAWHWLTEGKDSSGKAAFEVKTLDENNQFIEHLSHEVEIELWVSWLNRTITIRRELIQRWEKIRGEVTETYRGDKGKFFFDGSYLATAREYSDEINNILPIEVLRLLSDPSYFNNDSFYDWKKRRSLIFEMAGELSNEELAGGDEKYAILLQKYATKGEEKYKQEVSYALNELKKELAKFEPRIEENRRMKPEPQDWEVLRTQKAAAEESIKTLQAQIADLSLSRAEKSKEISALADQYAQLEQRANEIVSGIKARVQTQRSTAQFELKTVTNEITAQELQAKDLSNKSEFYTQSIADREKEISDLKIEYSNVYEETVVFDENKFKCFACDRDFDPENIEAERTKQKENFDTDKAKRLTAINAKAQAVIASKELAQKGLLGVAQSLTEIQEKIRALKEDAAIKKLAADKYPADADLYSLCAAEIGNNLDYQKLQTQMEVAKANLVAKQAAQTETQNLETEISDLSRKINEHNAIVQDCLVKLTAEQKIKDVDLRISQLEGEKKSTAQKVADWQRVLDTMLELNKRKVTLLEDKINSLFSLVKFRMFKKLNNGGFEECCECMIDGVPYSTNLNTGNKVLAGIDIVSALCRHYGVTVPLFVDNYESVTTDIYSPSQLILLKADRNVEKLTFN